MNREKVALIYLLKRVENYVNEVRAASYPQPPEVTGGVAYREMNHALEVVKEILEGKYD